MKINNSDTTNMFAHSIDNKMETNFQTNNQHSNPSIDLQAVLANANSQFMPKCPLCDKTFANSSNLKHHMNTIHFNEAKWICNECGKVCTSKSNLKVHLRVHLRVKPYYCRWCDYNCMHHSSIRDHLSKCHPEKSHNSCEPGYIFNSTAVPEPELSHFEPATNTVLNTIAHDYEDSDTKSNNKKYTNIANTNLNHLKTKRSFDDELNNSTNNINDQDLNENLTINNNTNTNTDDIKTSNLKRLKQDMEIEFNNKLLKKKKLLKKQRLRQKLMMNSFSLNSTNGDDHTKKVSSLEEDDAEELDNYDLDANNNSSSTNMNMNTYYSDTDEKDLIKHDDDDDDDQHNNDLLDSSNRQSSNLDDEPMFLMPNKFNNSNSNQASTSSSTSSTHSSSYSSNESKINYLKTPFNFMLQQPNDLVSTLLSGLPMDYNNNNNFNMSSLTNSNNISTESKSNGNMNNLAAFLIQHLSKVALFQQMKSNESLKLITNDLDNDHFSNEQTKNQLKSTSILNSNKNNRNLNCVLDLSLKTNSNGNNNNNSNNTSSTPKKAKLDDVDNEEYTSALSPVSTSSTNLSNTSTKSSKSSNDQQLQQQQQHQQQLQSKKSNDLITNKKNEIKKSGNNKAIQDVINRLSSNLPKSKENDNNHHHLQSHQQQNDSCCTKEEQSTNIDELNELIKSHLVPLTEAAFDKYRDFFQKKLVSPLSSCQKESNDLCKSSETTNESVVSSPLSSSSSPTSFVSSSDYKCTFCNILKNLLDLHQILHKV